ncbi:hypothetical protein [Zoogloea sp.]|uniref:hypothetical protein n=1 Tax=Zoogloea sp. TaxID=49181 RepID=UPI002603313C|nr:hypothetical protein [Zoogloea sp.]
MKLTGKKEDEHGSKSDYGRENCDENDLLPDRKIKQQAAHRFADAAGGEGEWGAWQGCERCPRHLSENRANFGKRLKTVGIVTIKPISKEIDFDFPRIKARGWKDSVLTNAD